MPVGATFKPEWKEYADRVSGVRVRQLTDWMGHSNHRYFTHPNWFEEGRKVLFASDRNNARDLFWLDLETGGIVQVTDAASMDPSGQGRVSRFAMEANPTQPEACFWLGRALYAVHLETFAVRRLFEAPEGYKSCNVSLTADGRFAIFGAQEDVSGRVPTDLNRRYVGMEKVHLAKPHCRILRVPLSGGEPECVWEEKCWIGHINTSPTDPQLLTFCHEGPWHMVDNRIWGFDLSTRQAWKIRPLDRLGRVGHEYWTADGERVGYHGTWPAPEYNGGEVMPAAEHFIGCIRHDNTDRVEFTFPHPTAHTHSLDFRRIVGDGDTMVLLWERQGDELFGPRVLCEHLSYMGWQRGHPHSVFHPDGRRVLFTSNRTDYGNLYLADVPEDIADLPEAEVE